MFFSWIRRAMERRAALLAVAQGTHLLGAGGAAGAGGTGANGAAGGTGAASGSDPGYQRGCGRKWTKTLQAALVLAPTTGSPRSTASPKRTGARHRSVGAQA